MKTLEEIKARMEEIRFEYCNAGYGGNEHMQHITFAQYRILQWLLGEQETGPTHNNEWYNQYRDKKRIAELKAELNRLEAK